MSPTRPAARSRGAALPAFFVLLLSGAIAPAEAEPASLEAVRQALRERTYAQAEALANERLRANPAEVELVYLHATALFHQGKNAAARAQAEALVAAHPQSAWVHKARFLVAECHSRERTFPEAVGILQAEALRLLSAERKRAVCQVVLGFADVLARVPDPNDPNELERPTPDYRKAYALYGKALELEIDGTQRAEVLFRRARCAEAISPRLALQHYEEYLLAFDPTWGDAPGHERRPIGRQRWDARERLIRAALASRDANRAIQLTEDLLALLETDRGASAPPALRATAAWLYLPALQLPRPRPDHLPAALRATDSFLAAHKAHPASVVAAFWRAQALAAHGRHEEAAQAFEAFLSGKEYALPPGEAAERPIDAQARGDFESSPRELQARWIPEAVFSLGLIRAQQARYSDAIKRFEDYTRRFPNGPRWAEAHTQIREAEFQLCLAAVSGLRYDEARASFDAFLAKHPLDGRAPQVLFLLGQVRVAEGEALSKQGQKAPAAQRFADAIAAWARLVSKYPQSQEASLALYRSGLLQEERLDQLEEALKTYRRVQGAASSQARARIELLTREQLSLESERVFRTDETAEVKLEVRNLETLSVRQYFLDLEGYFRKHHETAHVERLDIGLIQPDASFEVPVAGYRKFAPQSLKIPVPFPAGAAGVCLVSVSGGDWEATTLVIRSDLELVFRTSREELIAFVQDARRGVPAPKVKVLVTDGEKIFAEGTSGEDGVLRIQHERLARVGDLRLFAQLGGHVAASELSLSGLSGGLKLAPRGYLYTDRPAYQPGQTVHARGVVRAAGALGYELPSAKEYRVRLIGPRGRVLDEERATLSEFGAFCASFSLDARVPMGDYRVLATPAEGQEGPSAQTTLSVQQFELRPIELSLDAPRTAYRRGESVELSARARFAWGQPLVAKRVELSLPNGRSVTLTTDADGLVRHAFDTTAMTPGSPLSFRATLAEEGVSAQLTVFLPRLGFEIQVAPSQPLVLAGEALEVEVNTRGPDGKPLGRDLTLFVRRRETPAADPVLAEVPWFGPRRAPSAARTVKEQRFATDPKTGRARISLELAEGGDYLLQVVGEDRFLQQVVSEGHVKVSGEDDETRLRILSAEATLKVGLAHSLRLHSRLERPTLALVTYEGDAVLSYRILTLRPGFTPLVTAIDHLHFPNFRLSLTALSGQRLHTAHKDFRVERELKVTLKPRAQRLEPGASNEIEVEVTDQLGRPVRAELSLALVEETLYARFPERVASIRDAFEQGATRRAEFRVAASNGFRYAATPTRIVQALKDEANRLEDLSKAQEELLQLDKSLSSESQSLRRQRGARPKRMAPGAAPQPAAPMEDAYGGGAPEREEAGATEAAAPRQDRLGDGFWKCSLVTDDAGRATLTIPFPERATRWRLTARGASVTTLVGEARAEVVTAKDFFCELIAPRHLRHGDRPRLLARVHGLPGARVTLGLEVRQGERLLLSSTRDAITLDAAGGGEVLLPSLTVPSATALQMVLSASTAGALDRVAKEVEVLPWGEELSAHGGGTAEGDASVSLRLPAGELQSRYLSVLVGPSLEDTLSELALGAAQGWPESLGGRLVGLASALRYARVQGAEGADRATLVRLEAALREAMAAVAPREDPRGGFGIAGTPTLAETCLILWGLAASKELVAFTPDARASIRFLGNAYRQSRSQGERAQILHALAEFGQGDFKLANSLYRERAALDPVALSQLALVFQILDRPQIARELAGLLPGQQAPSGDPLSDAWQLLALARIQPGTPAAGRLAAALLQGRGTQRCVVLPGVEGLVVAALAAQLGQGAPASEDARITVLLDGQTLGTIERRGAQGATRLEVSPELLGDRREVVLQFRLEGRARYAYAATLRGFRPSYGDPTRGAWRVRWRHYRHAQLRHRGAEIGVQSTSPVSQIELGQRVEVEVDLQGRARPGSGLVVIEPLPAGLSLVPGSLQGSHVHHEVRDGELRLYYAAGSWIGRVRYSLVGRVTGAYRVPPTRIVDERDPSQIGRGAATELSVLALGQESPDPYQLNDSERLALGRLFFAEGNYAGALEHLTPLFGRTPRPAEQELAKTLLWIHTDSRFYDARMIVAAFEVLAVRYPELEVPFEKIFVVGRAYADLGEHERAMLVFRATIDASFLSDAAIAGVLSDQGQHLGAVDYQEALWWDYPNSAQVAASLFATSQRLYELAPQAASLAKEPRLEMPGLTGLPPAAERKAPTRISLLARTIRTLRAFLASHPQSPLADDAAFSLANAFLDLKRHEDVVALSARSLEVYPKSDFEGSFQYMRALGHFWRRDYALALSSAAVVAEGKTRFHELGKYILGQIHHAQGQPKQAIDWYRQVEDQFPDAKESIEYFTRRALSLPEVTSVLPGKPVELELTSRNLAKARLEVYKVDLMKLYLREKDLSRITKVELAGIAPQLRLDLALGSPIDYAERQTRAKLNLAEEGAYLVIVRGDDLFASGLVLITPLKIEVQEDESGRLRVNLQDEVKGLRPAGVHVKAVGSDDGNFKSGETDLRGVFVADGLRGKATVIAREGDARYAFHRGERWLGARREQLQRQLEAAPAVDYEGYLRKQNQVLQERSRSSWDEKRRKGRRGVQVQEAR